MGRVGQTRRSRGARERGELLGDRERVRHVLEPARDPGGAGSERFLDERDHGGELLCRGRAVAFADHDLAHRPAPDHRDEVRQVPARFERGEELLPVAGVDLDPVALAIALAPPGAHPVVDGHDRVAVLPHDLGRHALPDLRVGEVVGEDAEVGVGMDVYEPRRDDQPRDVQGLARRRVGERLDRHDPAVSDSDVGHERCRTRSVRDPPALEQQVERRPYEDAEGGPVPERGLNREGATRLQEPPSWQGLWQAEVVRRHAVR